MQTIYDCSLIDQVDASLCPAQTRLSLFHFALSPAPLAAYTCTFPLWGFMVERTGAFHYGLSKLALAKTCGDLEVDEQTKGVPF